MKLSEVIKVWDILHVKDTGDIGFCDLDTALNEVVGVENDIPNGQRQANRCEHGELKTAYCEPCGRIHSS